MMSHQFSAERNGSKGAPVDDCGVLLILSSVIRGIFFRDSVCFQPIGVSGSYFIMSLQ